MANANRLIRHITILDLSFLEYMILWHTKHQVKLNHCLHAYVCLHCSAVWVSHAKYLNANKTPSCSDPSSKHTKKESWDFPLYLQLKWWQTVILAFIGWLLKVIYSILVTSKIGIACNILYYFIVISIVCIFNNPQFANIADEFVFIRIVNF